MQSISAPGKVILAGEHAVVYGYPALLAAVNLRLRVTKKKISSEIPIGCGLGSSAALCVVKAATECISEKPSLNLEEISTMAHTMEMNYHINSSGADTTISTYGGFLWYQKRDEKVKADFKQIASKRKLPKFVLLNSGKPQETTAEMVGMIADFRKRNKKKTNYLFSAVEEVAKMFLKYLKGKRNVIVSELMIQNERILEELGVVSDSTKRLVKKVEKLGGAAKVTGAGGRKVNSGMLLSFHPDGQKLADFLRRQNLETYCVELGEEGVRLEETSTY